MTLDLSSLRQDLNLIESIEKATLRLVAQALVDFSAEASQIFLAEQDLVADIGEDITREALDRLGTSTLPVRLFGKMDYKRARYLFLPDFSVKQALFVDSKAEDVSGQRTATIQTAQTSMKIRQWRQGSLVEEEGKLPTVIPTQRGDLLTTTIFVKYNYTEETDPKSNQLLSINVLCLPNGLLQERYNPSADDTIWLAGRNAPSRGEAFRVRISLSRLRHKQRWRVQNILLSPSVSFSWDE